MKLQALLYLLLFEVQDAYSVESHCSPNGVLKHSGTKVESLEEPQGCSVVFLLFVKVCQIEGCMCLFLGITCLKSCLGFYHNVLNCGRLSEILTTNWDRWCPTLDWVKWS